MSCQPIDYASTVCGYGLTGAIRRPPMPVGALRNTQDERCGAANEALCPYIAWARRVTLALQVVELC